MNFNDYKNRISIIQVAEYLGYKQDLSGGKISPVFKRNFSSGEVSEIVIKEPYNYSKQTYFDRKYNRGDIITFIKNHIDEFHQFLDSNEYVKINKILAYFANIDYVATTQNFYKKENEKLEFDTNRYITQETKITDLKYLTYDRKISEETILKFLPYITRVQDKENSRNFINIAFPFKVPGVNKISTYEMVNNNYKGYPSNGDKRNAVWLADFTNDNKSVKNVYIGESAIDVMSFYELHKENINLSESVFVSVGGRFAENQIKNVLNYYNNAIINTCFDNDISGNIYDILVASIMLNQKLLVKKLSDEVIFQLPNMEFSMSKNEVTFDLYKIKTNINQIPLIVHKPSGAKDFNDELKDIYK